MLGKIHNWKRLRESEINCSYSNYVSFLSYIETNVFKWYVTNWLGYIMFLPIITGWAKHIKSLKWLIVVCALNLQTDTYRTGFPCSHSRGCRTTDLWIPLPPHECYFLHLLCYGACLQIKHIYQPGTLGYHHSKEEPWFK